MTDPPTRVGDAVARPAADSGRALSDASGPLGALRGSRTWRLLSRALAVLIVAGSLYYLVRTFRSELSAIRLAELRVVPGPLVVSALLTLLCVLLGGAIWQRVLRGLGMRMSLRQCMSTHLLANLGGYVPGYAWKHLGKAYLTRGLGVSGRQASTAVVVEFVGLALTRAAVSASSLSGAWLADRGIAVSDGLLWAIRVASWGALLLPLWALGATGHRLRGRWARVWQGVAIRRAELGAALALMCVTWVLYGVGFAALLHAIHPIGPEQFASSVFAASTSFLVSLMVFFVPAGLTVREGVITLALTGVVPGGVAVLAALLSRVVLIICEVVGAIVGACLRHGCRYVDSPNG